jgi:type I restriction enzyme, S subunit
MMIRGDCGEFDVDEGMSEWRNYKLGQLVDQGIADLQTGPFGTMLNASEYTATGIPVIAVQDIGENKLKHNKFVYVDESTVSRLSRYKVKEGDIIFGRKGAVERRAIIKKNEEGWLQGSDCIRVRFNSSIDSTFISYQFGSQSYKEWMFQNSTGATMPSLNQQVLKLLPITLPPLPEQKTIASILSSLDDKIDLLHRQNRTLEAIAETFFRQWFIEEAQADWEEGTLGSEFDFTMGQSPSGSSFNEEGIGVPMFQGNADFGFRFPMERVYTTEPTRFAKQLDTLVRVRAPVGAQNMAHKECCIGRGVAAFRYKKDSHFYTYTYFKLRSLMEEIKKFNDEGTVFGSISKSDFEALVVTIPSSELILRFENVLKPVNDKVIKNCQQIRILEKLRDTLLPKLMSGEVRVKV